MSRRVLYQALALIPFIQTGPNTTTWGWQPENPVAFANPVNAAVQQHAAHQNFQVPTAVTPHGWEGQQLEYRFATPFPATAQQFQALPLEHIPQAVDVDGFFHFELDYKFAVPFPARAQQFNSFEPAGFIRTTLPDGWRHPELEYRFKKPFPVEQQQYKAQTDHLIPSAPTPLAWWPQPPDVFAKPFPAIEQQFTAYFKFPPAITPQGWYPQPPDVFAQPFPANEQIFSVWDLVGDVPPYLPPGAGKRYKKPTSYLPEPAYEAKPAKKFRPVWDRPKPAEPGEPEPKKEALGLGPPPLPPPELFGAPTQQPTLDISALPTFGHLVPQGTEELGQRLQDAQDMGDAIAVLRALGFLPNEEA